MMGFVIGYLLGLLTSVAMIVIHKIMSQTRLFRRLEEIDKERKQIKSDINKIKNKFK